MGVVHADSLVSPPPGAGVIAAPASMPSGDTTGERRRRYCLITPCRDEAAFARRTLDSVVRQTVSPARWLIVDDGSHDETPAIVEEYIASFPYIELIRRPDRGSRRLGGGVIEAFDEAYNRLDPDEFDYVCKLDLDLDLPRGYFEAIMARMDANPRLGTCSGKPWFVHPTTGTLVPEVCGNEMSVGMAKFYRVGCFREIGGFVREVMWDGIDCHRARMLGWIAESVDEEALRFVHLRPQGSSHRSIWTGRVRAGFGQYYMGTAPLYYLASALSRLFEHPAIRGSAAMLWGYASSAFKGAARYDDPDFRRFLRTYQRNCLLKGKKTATVKLNARQASIWHAAHSGAHLDRRAF
jgi:biofilm PGA synthesis N-glycosyltransferase PgaC